jgi:hypothetical protein
MNDLMSAGVVPIVEYDADGIIADRLDGTHADLVLAELQCLLPRPVTAHFGRRRVDAQVFEWQLEARPVVEGDFEKT